MAEIHDTSRNFVSIAPGVGYRYAAEEQYNYWKGKGKPTGKAQYESLVKAKVEQQKKIAARSKKAKSATKRQQPKQQDQQPKQQDQRAAEHSFASFGSPTKAALTSPLPRAALAPSLLSSPVNNFVPASPAFCNLNFQPPTMTHTMNADNPYSMLVADAEVRLRDHRPDVITQQAFPHHSTPQPLHTRDTVPALGAHSVPPPDLRERIRQPLDKSRTETGGAVTQEAR